MAVWSRLGAGLTLAVAVGAPIAGAAWCWNTFGRCCFVELTEQLAREGRRREALDRSAAALIPASAEKERITQELIAGRLSLSEAATAFRRAEAGRATGEDDEALWARVLKWAGAALERDPARAAVVLPALEAEFRSCYGHAPARR